MNTQTVLTGNLTTDPELRFTPDGVAVAHVTVASTPRLFDQRSGEWRDGQTLFLLCTLWRHTAQNAAETLRRGMRVIVTGRLTPHSFETRDGNRRIVIELDVEDMGPSLRYATATVITSRRSATAAAPSGQPADEDATPVAQQSSA